MIQQSDPPQGYMYNNIAYSKYGSQTTLICDVCRAAMLLVYILKGSILKTCTFKRKFLLYVEIWDWT